MSGGKETPRQKMIGMMYLVLTALLALNVSKSILDAFVAIEENTQKSNIVQVDKGNAFKADVVSELGSTKDDAENKAKREKLTYVIAQMEKIDKEAGAMIKKIDEVKVLILEKSGENIIPENKSEEAIIWTSYDAKKDQILPARMYLMAVQGKDQFDVPMHEIIGDDIKNPSGEGINLWNDLLNYRKRIVSLTGSYEWSGKTYSIEPKNINKYKDNADLTKQVTDMVEKSKAGKDDKQALIDLYISLTKLEKNEVHGIEGVHWIGMTFNHSPLVAALASLSALQTDVLTARSIALGHWKSKVSTGEYSFDKIMPLAYGPAVANSGDSINIEVLMAAFDSQSQPVVVLNEGPEGAEIVYPGNGTGVVSLRAGGSTMEFSGTVSIKNKSGTAKTETWTHTVQIMKPQGSIELPDMNVLYRGYPNKVDPTASGYPTTVLTGAGNVTVKKSGPIYIASPGRSKKAFLSVSGRTADGKTVQLKKVEYRVENLPNPSLYWGGKESGGKANKNSGLLQAKYGPGIPLEAKFTIISWSFQSAAANKPKKGSGGNIGSVSTIIRATKPGQQVGFVCTVRGPDGKTRKIGGTWTI